MTDNMKRLLTAAVLGIGLIFAVAALVIAINFGSADAGRESDAIIKINELQQQRVDLYSKVALLENDKGKTEFGGAAVFLCFDNADANLYEIVFPTVTYHGFRALFTFKHDVCPGDEGMITPQQYNELIAAQWQSAVKYKAEADYTKMKTAFSALGIPFPEIMVFDNGDYSSDLVPWLNEMGIKLCICNTDAQDDMLKIASEPIMYNQSVVKLRTNRAMNDGTPLVIRTGRVKRYVDDRKVDCDLEKYEEMLRWLKIMQNKRRLKLQNTYDTADVFEIITESTEKAVENKAEIERLEADIAELDEQINELKKIVKQK